MFDGIATASSLLGGDLLTGLVTRIGRTYEPLESPSGSDRDAAIQAVQDRGGKYIRTASSLSLEAVLGPAEWYQLIRAVLVPPTRKWITEHLSGRLSVDLDQAWIRRQYAPGQYPAFHAPHAWHQDGALGYDFLGQARSPENGLLQMVTVWIALGPCGVDAPGLEFLTAPIPRVLQPEELLDSRLRNGFRPDQFWVPSLPAGDALLFTGAVPHRTYVTPAMVRPRTSVELRFFGERPARLSADRFMEVTS